MNKNIKTQVKDVVGGSLNSYHQTLRPKVDDIVKKEEYQERIIDCMVGEVEQDSVVIDEVEVVIPYKRHLKELKTDVQNNTDDIDDNIIPYLMDIEYNILTMGGE